VGSTDGHSGYSWVGVSLIKGDLGEEEEVVGGAICEI
jgi:hypothetical protein